LLPEAWLRGALVQYGNHAENMPTPAQPCNMTGNATTSVCDRAQQLEQRPELRASIG
jgi:hypothetical protein